MMFPLPDDVKKLGKAYSIWYTVLLYLGFAYFTLTIGIFLYMVQINLYIVLGFLLKAWGFGGIGVYLLLKFVKKK